MTETLSANAVDRTVRTAVITAIAGAFGLLAAMTLTIERFAMLSDPSRALSCDLNPVLSCGSVMGTAQAAVLGFPNPLLGIVGFTVVVVSGVLVAAGIALPGWFRIGLAIGATVALIFVHWLMFQSIYRIGAVCPYCVVVWIATMIVWLTTVPSALGAHRAAAAVRDWAPYVLTVWAVIVTMAIVVEFWDYWSTLL